MYSGSRAETPGLVSINRELSKIKGQLIVRMTSLRCFMNYAENRGVFATVEALECVHAVADSSVAR